ncbi:MAG: hypothetical protein H7Y61_18625 [Rhizobiales bacterium]|nr:hypothetical protein [Rhizobacter sp.]
MTYLSRTLMCACFAMAASSTFAQDAMKKNEPMKDGMKKEMTMQECKDHMAMAKKDGMKKDDAMMKSDKTCSDMMKKDGGMMNKGTPPVDPMKK